MLAEDHMHLKMASASLGISMKKFILTAAFEKMENIEDAWLAEKAKDTLKRIESGEEKTIPWKTARSKK
jgi:predicted DNA-binding protein